MKDLSLLPIHCRLFKDMTAKELNRMLPCLGAHTAALRKGEMLFRPGMKAEWFGVLLSGGLTVSTYDGDGRRNIIKHVSPIEVVAAAQAFAGNGTMIVGVEAETASEVLLLKSDRATMPCEKVCAAHLRLVRNLVGIMAAKTLELNGKIGILSRRNTADRLLTYLREIAKKSGSRKFDIPFNRQGLADFLCVERSALSAEIGRLSREGVLTAHKSHFTLHIR